MPPGPRMRKHLVVHLPLIARTRLGYLFRRTGGRHIRLREHLVDVVHQLRKGRRLAIARLRQRHRKIRANVARIPPQNHNAIGQQHGFLNIVRNQKHRLRGHGLLGPKLQQFAAQVLSRQHVERRERLIHKENFGLNHQRASESDALPHSARKLLGISRLKSVQADHVQHLHAAFAALSRRHAARLQRSFNILKNREPGKQREALKDDRDVDLGLGNGLAMPINLARRGHGEPGQHAQHGRFA